MMGEGRAFVVVDNNVSKVATPPRHIGAKNKRRLNERSARVDQSSVSAETVKAFGHIENKVPSVGHVTGFGVSSEFLGSKPRRNVRAASQDDSFGDLVVGMYSIAMQRAQDLRNQRRLDFWANRFSSLRLLGATWLALVENECGQRIPVVNVDWRVSEASFGRQRSSDFAPHWRRGDEKHRLAAPGQSVRSGEECGGLSGPTTANETGSTEGKVDNIGGVGAEPRHFAVDANADPLPRSTSFFVPNGLGASFMPRRSNCATVPYAIRTLHGPAQDHMGSTRRLLASC